MSKRTETTRSLHIHMDVFTRQAYEARWGKTYRDLPKRAFVTYGKRKFVSRIAMEFGPSYFEMLKGC